MISELMLAQPEQTIGTITITRTAGPQRLTDRQTAILLRADEVME
jgi:hypothetical protein